MSGNKEQIDVSLIGNDKIEEAIVNIQKAPTEENLVRALSIVRHRMNDKGQLIIAVEPPLPDGKLNLQVIKTEDGQMWWTAYTSFDEELKGADNIKSTFLTDIDKLLKSALQSVPSPPLSAANVSKRTAKILSQLRQTFGRRTTKEC